MTKTPETIKTAIAHGNYVRGSASKVRRVLDQIRGRSYRDALICWNLCLTDLQTLLLKF